ncbi:MAG TPA: NAD(+) diphosphatase [Caulobacteraceae bacterium]|nr:NAD(+) diphosphatase [Caulobacteraceae bacterium]
MSDASHQHIFSGNRLDRAGGQRGDADWLAARIADPAAVSLVLWNGRPLLTHLPDGTLTAARIDGGLARALAGGLETLVFLGLGPQGPVLAIDLDGETDPAEGPLQGLGKFHDLRAALASFPAEDANLVGTARSLFEWRRKHRFCSACGRPSRASDGGWKRVCPNCKTQHFPRVDPCVIMLPARGEHCLLGRQASWPEGRFSTLAGFVEPGESVEEACAREVREESGLTVTGVRYHSSQPWPFPSNLMIGLIAEVAEGEAAPDLEELEAVRWFTRAEARDLLDGKLPGVTSPAPVAIAYHLIRAWVDDGA